MDNNIKANGTESRTLMTMEERLRMAADSRAASPEAAASLVQRLSETQSVDFFCGNEELDRMFQLIGEYMEQVDEEILWYVGLCHSFRLMRESEGDPFRLFSLEMPTKEEWNLCQPVWGFKVNDALVLMGLMLLDHAKGRMRSREIYHCMRMTLKQYLDALVDINFQENGTLDQGRAESYRVCRDMLLKDYDGSKPLGEALADILRNYIAGWREFDHLDYILTCMEGLSEHLEREALPPELEDGWQQFLAEMNQYVSGLDGVEIVEECLDPEGYYFNLACEYPEDVPDPDSGDIAQGALYDSLFLPQRDYRSDSLRELAAQAPTLKMRSLLEEHICEERLTSAMREVNKTVTDLYFLFVNPYLQMREYHYERHLES